MPSTCNQPTAPPPAKYFGICFTTENSSPYGSIPSLLSPRPGPTNTGRQIFRSAAPRHQFLAWWPAVARRWREGRGGGGWLNRNPARYPSAAPPTFTFTLSTFSFPHPTCPAHATPSGPVRLGPVRSGLVRSGRRCLLGLALACLRRPWYNETLAVLRSLGAAAAAPTQRPLPA